MNFENIVAKYRLEALYDNDSDYSDYVSSVSSDTGSESSGSSGCSYPGCSSKKSCHVAILLKGL